MKDAITRIFAVIVTGLAVLIAISSAWQRAGTDLDRMLLAGLSAVIVLAVHLLPALLGRMSRLVIWPVWCLCFMAALWSHVWFFANASHGAAENRSASSAKVQAIQGQRATIEATLAANKARSAATVAGILSRTKDPDARAALEIELTEGRRANEMRAKLVDLTEQEAAGVEVDPVSARVTAVTGLPIEAISTWSGVVIAMLLEVLGSLLWVAVLSGQIEQRDPNDSEMIERLYVALENSEISPTEEDICRFISGCSKDSAKRLLRGLEVRMALG